MAGSQTSGFTTVAGLESWLVGAACFFWGTSQIAPPDSIADFSVARVNIGDLCFLFSLALLVASTAFRNHVRLFLTQCRVFSLLVVAFGALGLASSYANAYVRELTLNDILEVCRPVYYLGVVAVIAYLVRKGDILRIVSFYVTGVLFASAVNLGRIVAVDDALLGDGLLIFFNPNVTGHMVAVALLFSTLLLHFGWVIRGIVLANISLVLVFFSLSKGAWLMTVIALLMFAVLFNAKRKRGELRKTGGPALVWLSVAVVAAGVLWNWDMLEAALQVKVNQSFTDETEQSESSVALRLGHIVSSLDMAARNPILGVGVTNWQTENAANSYWLNDVFLSNDNPHNAFVYILACLGLPALIAFIAIILFPVISLPESLRLSRRETTATKLLMFGFLFMSGSVQLHIVTHYFFWLICGIAFGCALRNSDRVPAIESQGSGVLLA